MGSNEQEAMSRKQKAMSNEWSVMSDECLELLKPLCETYVPYVLCGKNLNSMIRVEYNLKRKYL